MSENNKPRIWKRKRMTEKAFKNRLRLVEVGKKFRKLKNNESESPNLQIDGRCIVHIETLANQLFCEACNEILSLQDMIDSKSQGAATIFIIRCRKCLKINTISSDKQHLAATGKLHFDINTKIAIGALHSGMGNVCIKKFFAAMNLPSVSSKVFKTHEREVGLHGEELAKESCKAAALLERDLTIKNEKEIVNLLPDHLKTGFLVHNPDPTKDPVIRFAASFDLGWSTRGTGRNYDSLNGFGALIGRESGKVLDFSTKQRKCRKCDLGHPRDDHDCRCNFVGSAKAMEPRAALDVTVNSMVLKECNMSLGILIGDDDCSTIAAVRQASNHEIVKFSDKNHVSKGLTNELYKLKVYHKELTKEIIQYLHRCFTYAVEQNRGFIVEMSNSIRSIPEHCFNNHTNCGQWCAHHKDPNSYKHKTIRDGLKSEKLLKDLQDLFNKIALNSHKFVAAASSQSNESLNATMASKAPKSRCYSTSESASFRYAYSVCQKNIGEQYIQDIAKKLCLSPGKNTSKHIERVKNTFETRSITIKKPEFKRRRLFLKKQKTELRNKRERSEGIIYQSNIGLLSYGDINNNMNIAEFEDDSLAIVFFDLETSGFGKNAEILQIAALWDNNTSFSIYVYPQRGIPDRVSAVNGLSLDQGNLLLNGDRQDATTLREALLGFYNFLIKINKKCVLTAHNCNFDQSHLLNSIGSVNMMDYFQSVVHAFADTLSIIKKKKGKNCKDDNSLRGLANTFQISNEGAHNAIHDVKVLKLIIEKLNITESEIIENANCWSEVIKKRSEASAMTNALQNLIPLRNCISYTMKKKIVDANITFEMIMEAYRNKNILGLHFLLGEDETGAVKVTKSKKVLARLSEFLEKIK